MLTSTARKPRAIITVNGTRVAWLSIDTNSNGNYQADTFRIVVPVKEGQPEGIDRDWWVDQSQMEVEIFFGFPDTENYTQGNLTSMFLGAVDNIIDDLVLDTLTLTGRDYTAPLIDTKTTMKWPDRRASDVIKAIATKHGLGYSVQPTRIKIGTYYKHNQSKLTSESTEWDLITWLAQEEGYQVYVDHKVLHFEPIPDNPPSWDLVWVGGANKKFDGTKITFDRNLTLAKDVIVKVRSFDPNTGKVVEKEAKAAHTKDKITRKTQMNIGQPQVYSYVFPGLTAERALRKAQSIRDLISRHQIKLVADGIPADTVLTPRHVIKVAGTWSYDQIYHPDSVIRRMSISDGFRMDIIAKNHNVNSTVIV